MNGAAGGTQAGVIVGDDEFDGAWRVNGTNVPNLAAPTQHE